MVGTRANSFFLLRSMTSLSILFLFSLAKLRVCSDLLSNGCLSYNWTIVNEDCKGDTEYACESMVIWGGDWNMPDCLVRFDTRTRNPVFCDFKLPNSRSIGFSVARMARDPSKTEQMIELCECWVALNFDNVSRNDCNDCSRHVNIHNIRSYRATNCPTTTTSWTSTWNARISSSTSTSMASTSQIEAERHRKNPKSSLPGYQLILIILAAIFAVLGATTVLTVMCYRMNRNSFRGSGTLKRKKTLYHAEKVVKGLVLTGNKRMKTVTKKNLPGPANKGPYKATTTTTSMASIFQSVQNRHDQGLALYR